MILLNNAVANRYKVGQEITVKVKAVYYTRDVPQLVGEIVPGTKRQVMVEVDRRKIKTLLDTEDDELTGLEVVEVAGKGRGVRAVHRGRQRGHEGGGGGQRPPADPLRLQGYQDQGENPVRLRRAGPGS